MKIEEAQDMMRRIYLERDQARGVEGTLKRTFDELEELSEAIKNRDTAQAIADEVADVFAWLCSLANLLEIDVSDAFYKKYNNTCSKCKKSPCICPEPLDLM
ncbi:MAG: nucleotide pyrophosphohydrolase [Candidatus Thorarchaeota archaeon]|nr:nucleotide pyrophosphohydrolase [Candidatus Thorarchaeota archaeon]